MVRPPIGEILGERRKAQGLRIEEIAEKAGITLTTHLPDVNRLQTLVPCGFEGIFKFHMYGKRNIYQSGSRTMTGFQNPCMAMLKS